MTFEFNLQAPGEVDPTKAKVPDWLELDISKATTSYPAEILGRINLKMASSSLDESDNAPPFVGLDRSRMYTPAPAVIGDAVQNYWEDTCDYLGFGGNGTEKLEKLNSESPHSLKAFTDGISLRLFNVLVRTPDDARSEVKARITSLVDSLEFGY